MTTPTSAQKTCDPWEMALIHRLIRRGFKQSGEFVLAEGAGARAGAVAEYVGFHLDALHAHHTSEDELLWPALHERASMSDALITRMEQQHEGVHGALETVRRELAPWAATPTADGADSLAAALRTVTGHLAEHLAEEERDVVPLIAAHITQAEWEHLGEVSFGKFTRRQRFTAMGELLEAADPVAAARMMADLPTPIRVVWRLLGRRRYERFMVEVRGTGSGSGSRTGRQHESAGDGGKPRSRSRTAAWVTWTYAAMFGVPAVPVAIFLGSKGRLPSLGGLFDMYAGPWSTRFPDDRVIALLLVHSGLVLAAVVSGWLLWEGRKAGAVLNLALLPVEAVFWVGFALPIPWLFGIARVALVARAWPELSGSRRQASAAGPATSRPSS